MIVFPAFVDYEAARRFPLVVPPIPLDAETFPLRTKFHIFANGECWVVDR